MKLTRSLEVKLPTLPNFINVGDISVGVENFTVEELDAIGREWLKALIEHAENRRKMNSFNDTGPR